MVARRYHRIRISSSRRNQDLTEYLQHPSEDGCCFFTVFFWNTVFTFHGIYDIMVENSSLTEDNMKNFKISSMIFYIAAILFYVAAIIGFTSGNEEFPSAMYLCLGSAFLCFGSLFYSKSKDDKKDNDGNENEEIQRYKREYAVYRIFLERLALKLCLRHISGVNELAKINVEAL